MKTYGFGLAGYRSFGDDHQFFGPLQKINLFIGQNNSGKSNILKFIHDHLGPSVISIGEKRFDSKFSSLDLHQTLKDRRIEFSLALPKDHEKIKKFRELALSKRMSEQVNKILTSSAITHDQELIWFVFVSKPMGNPFELSKKYIKKIAELEIPHRGNWQGISQLLFNNPSNDLEKFILPRFYSDFLRPLQIEYVVNEIPAIRQIGDASTDHIDYSGLGIIKKLAELQNPEIHEQENRQKFDKINDFLRNVTGNDNAEIEIPFARQSITIHMDGKTLPLTSLGTGIHEVIILAAAATMLENQTVCIEEPELHLHPILQRKLIRYLLDNTSNQYFISTHSVHLMHPKDVSVFHVTLKDGATIIDKADTDREKSFICNDLGYRATDIMQSSAVIWVEGPSDRIYINHWIKKSNSTFIEGVHYSIMFYGGSLISHLSADDDIVQEFVSLTRLNRNSCIIFDSDQPSKDARLSDAKNRIKIEFNRHAGFAWVTAGREIENYVHKDILDKAIKKTHRKVKNTGPFGQYSNVTKFTHQDDKKREINKVRLARAVVDMNPELDILDLKRNITKICKLIASANGL